MTNPCRHMTLIAYETYDLKMNSKMEKFTLKFLYVVVYVRVCV